MLLDVECATTIAARRAKRMLAATPPRMPSTRASGAQLGPRHDSRDDTREIGKHLVLAAGACLPRRHAPSTQRAATIAIRSNAPHSSACPALDGACRPSVSCRNAHPRLALASQLPHLIDMAWTDQRLVALEL